MRTWLAECSAHASELIVGFVKTHTGKATLTWPQAVDEALCFGWIDGVRTSIDKNHYKIRFSPRKPNSKWSAVNIKRVPELEADGRMTKAGLAVFALRTEARSRTGSYEQAEFPELSAAELAEFRKNRSAWAFYEKLPPSYRRKVNWLIISAKQEATRARRFTALVSACAEGRRDY
ncbi:MAG: YdeI/OmpD-associated family protein [Ideonella sp.]|nr:YdeI/OmpD-associated family protein [Ideonella sp.]